MKKYLAIFIICTVFSATVSGCGYYNGSLMHINNRLNKGQEGKLNKIMFACLNIPEKVKYFEFSTRLSKAGIVNKIPYRTVAAGKTGFKRASNHAVRKPFKLTVNGNVLHLKFIGRSAKICKAYSIDNLMVNIKGFRYYRGYEIVLLSIKNKGGDVAVSDNFEYSNAGNPFIVKKFETLKNLTLANKYKKGMKLWLKL